MNPIRLIPLVFALTLVVAMPAAAAEPTGPATEKEEKLLAEVSKRLLAKMDPVPGYQWPPTIEIVPSAKLNAWTYVEKNELFPELKPKPIIQVTVPWMRKIVKGEEDVLAITLGHELGHIHYRHTLTRTPGDTTLVRTFYQRDKEYEADDFGVKLLLKADYSLRKAIRGDMRIKEYAKRHAPLDTITYDHAGWNDRYLRITRDPKYWRAMNAFDNGVAFLAAEQYLAARLCFKQVTDEFPSCYEGWVNLGYATLMLYCDKMKEEDIRKMEVGHVVCGGFYRRVHSLMGFRAKDLWFEAVGALREANRINPNLALAKANLGLAYLLQPEGKQVGEASRLLQEAVDLVKEDKTLDPMARAMLLVNLGVAQLSGEQRAEGLKMLDEGLALAKTLKGAENTAVTEAVLYNRALARANTGKAEDRKQAATLFEQYLGQSDPRSAWWPVAYTKYEDLCEKLERAPRKKEDLQKGRRSRLRMQTTLDLGGDKGVSVSELTEDVLKRFSKPRTVPVAGSSISQHVFDKEHFELLATDRVIAVVVRSARAPAVALRPRGLATTPAVELKVGMSRKEAEARLPNPGDYVFRELTEKDKAYWFYRNLGLAILYDSESADSKISELVLVQIPE